MLYSSHRKFECSRTLDFTLPSILIVKSFSVGFLIGVPVVGSPVAGLLSIANAVLMVSLAAFSRR